jgi:hypothetical protein
VIEMLFALVLTAAQTDSLPILVLPEREGAWVVRIETSGGFTGRGSGSFTASSAGEVLCVLTGPCPSRLVPEAQQSLGQLVAGIPLSADASPRAPAVYPGICNDCVTTTLTVQRRSGDGERTTSFRWDETTQGTVPGEVLRLHSAVVALSRVR